MFDQYVYCIDNIDMLININSNINILIFIVAVNNIIKIILHSNYSLFYSLLS